MLLRTARGTAVVSGIFTVVVAVLIIVSWVQLKQVTPADSPVLKQLQAEGKLRMPVYVDSPLSSKALAVYRKHPETQRPGMHRGIGKGCPYAFKELTVLSDKAKSRRLDTLKGPAVIISSAGMANAGRILRHLTNHASDPNNGIAIVGYMTPDSPGRRIRNGDPVVRLNGHDVKINAQVSRLKAFSGHADKDDLLWWAKGCGSNVKQFFVVHGEPCPGERIRAKPGVRGQAGHRSSTGRHRRHQLICSLLISFHRATISAGLRWKGCDGGGARPPG